MGAAFKKVCKIHEQLPAGGRYQQCGIQFLAHDVAVAGILVFLTGQREIEDVCTRLCEKYNKERQVMHTGANDDEGEAAERLCSPVRVLPLYSALPAAKQMLVFAGNVFKTL